MTRISQTDYSTKQGGDSSAQSAQRGRSQSWEGLAGRGGRQSGLGHGFGPDAKAYGWADPQSVEAFARSARHALDEQERDSEQRENAQPLLVYASWQPFVSAPATHEVNSNPPQRADEIINLAARIEHALQADLSAAGPQPITLNINVDDVLDGIGIISVSLSESALDIVFSAQSGVSPQLVEAAQFLADRLHTRFPRRVIRVFDGRGAADVADEPAGLNQISSLMTKGAAHGS